MESLIFTIAVFAVFIYIVKSDSKVVKSQIDIVLGLAGVSYRPSNFTCNAIAAIIFYIVFVVVLD